jgi:hypothetical protein
VSVGNSSCIVGKYIFLYGEGKQFIIDGIVYPVSQVAGQLLFRSGKWLIGFVHLNWNRLGMHSMIEDQQKKDFREDPGIYERVHHRFADRPN